MREVHLEARWKDHAIEVKCTVLDQGIHILITGGCRTHVGAVSYGFPGEKTKTVQFPGHRDGAVSEKWAEYLCQRFQVPVIVNCGIHYDHVDRNDIESIVSVTDKLLHQAETLLGKNALS